MSLSFNLAVWLSTCKSTQISQTERPLTAEVSNTDLLAEIRDPNQSEHLWVVPETLCSMEAPLCNILGFYSHMTVGCVPGVLLCLEPECCCQILRGLWVLWGTRWGLCGASFFCFVLDHPRRNMNTIKHKSTTIYLMGSEWTHNASFKDAAIWSFQYLISFKNIWIRLEEERQHVVLKQMQQQPPPLGCWGFSWGVWILVRRIPRVEPFCVSVFVVEALMCV